MAIALLTVCWISLAAGFIHSHRPKPQQGPPSPRRVDRGSDLGLVLQLAAVAAAFWFRRTDPAPLGAQIIAIILAPVSVVLAWKSVIALGRHWRVRAIVTADHQLITSGPYSLLRHPVYTAFLGILVATALLLTDPVAAMASVAVFVLGTEIRVRSEEKLLAQQFGDVHRQWCGRVRAYIPFIR